MNPSSPKYVPNGDSPVGRRVTDAFLLNPQMGKLVVDSTDVHLTSSGSEVFTTAFPERTSVVSHFEEQSFGSKAFSDRFDTDEHLGDELLKFAKYTVNVYSFYTPIDESASSVCLAESEGAAFSSPIVPSEISGTVCYAGSGIIFKKNERLYVLTARHNILSKRRPAPKEPHNLQRKLIRVTLPHVSVTRSWRNATRHDQPTHEDPDLRKSHTYTLEETYKWRHNSDFAVLEVGDDPNAHTKRDQCIFKHYLPFDDLLTGITANIEDEVFVYGVPVALTEAEHKKKQPDISYSEFQRIFSPSKLHVCYGKVINANETMCGYNANTAGGMSGGPVFLYRDSKLLLVGLHAGGSALSKMNQFVPLVMPQLYEMLKDVGTASRNESFCTIECASIEII